MGYCSSNVDRFYYLPIGVQGTNYLRNFVDSKEILENKNSIYIYIYIYNNNVKVCLALLKQTPVCFKGALSGLRKTLAKKSPKKAEN